MVDCVVYNVMFLNDMGVCVCVVGGGWGVSGCVCVGFVVCEGCMSVGVE